MTIYFIVGPLTNKKCYSLYFLSNELCVYHNDCDEVSSFEIYQLFNAFQRRIRGIILLNLFSLVLKASSQKLQIYSCVSSLEYKKKLLEFAVVSGKKFVYVNITHILVSLWLLQSKLLIN